MAVHLAADPVLARVRRFTRVYALTVWYSLKAQKAYKLDFTISLVNGILFQGSMALFVVALMSRFESLAGWSRQDVLLIVAVRTCGHALYVFFFSNIAAVQTLLREGNFDRYFTTPLSVLSQVLLFRVNFNAVGDTITGLALLAYAVAQSAIGWGPRECAVLLLALVGAALIEAALQLVVAAAGLRHGGFEGLSTGIETTVSTVTPYPLSILSAAPRFLSYTILPVAYVAYVPTALILGRSDAYGGHPALGYLALLTGPALCLLALVYWRHRMKTYQPIGG
ncbi:ABC-2 family transporter protein [Streptomyces anulatus]|uniref:ABC transporter permease n=1 Tax=Streptomycetaceae TaxID=2062 RepID=UPI00067B37EE|nr:MULTISPECIES: ABC-2 family transporter protein [Streptomyces]KND27604.1 hypothetical protein IQ60_26025 [Streptomyces europaeiscabiei]KQX36681.1 hypothetical protein ASD29_05345 [Streptomyces sp. Root1295]KRA36511.1 hypothetical protein ASD97_20185 [Streptomyces sp. Root63]MBT1098791.1 ABC-2 family transporter protein [Streptomyces sp. Tu10]WSR77692.1 ABC-2 family transporter protein [Streptomyces anulatus]